MKISLPLIRPVTAGAWLLLFVFLNSGAIASGAGLATGVAAQSGGGVALNPSHPERYVVKRGDTLWDISAMFLRDPWYWPEIWQVNPQVVNPHLIYPGDILSLVYIDGRPQIRLERGGTARGGDEKLSPRIRSEDLSDAILTIPLETISAFLSKGMVLERGQADKMPYIVAIKEGHLIGGAGNDLYVRGKGIGPVNYGYSVVHVGEPLVDPDDKELVGYEGIFVGEGLIARTGDPATLHLVDSQREALVGDKLLEQSFDIPLQFTPRSPDEDITGRIIHVIDGLANIGQYAIVVLNRGDRHGLEVGHVLRVWQAGEKVRDRTKGGSVRLPDEPAGTLMVFKTYDRISYGLIMEATTDIHILDKVRAPNQ